MPEIVNPRIEGYLDRAHECRRRIRELPEDCLASDDDKFVLDEVGSGSQNVLKLVAFHARSSTARERRRRSCSFRCTPS